jgi:transcriptional regulator of aromatic amino acid metabolism
LTWPSSLEQAANRRQLEDAYESRVERILEAMADEHSLREVAEHLRMSHTAVAKALDGVGT